MCKHHRGQERKFVSPNASGSCASLAPRTDEMQLEESGALAGKKNAEMHLRRQGWLV